jgi:nicotinic acid mononucleotide adenylyltransferase
MWAEKLKQLNVSIHVIATGGGAGLQEKLWSVPGSSAYLSGASFPYSMEEHDELLGFKPEKYCSPEDAVDLASAAYMKAYRFDGKKPVGVGITASVASERMHRGNHHAHVAIMTDDSVSILNMSLVKGVGEVQRYQDGKLCDDAGYFLIIKQLGLLDDKLEISNEDATSLAYERFWRRPYFTASGQRLAKLEVDHHALLPGAFNPPHEGHYGMAHEVEKIGYQVVFTTTVNPPHKGVLSVQDCLKRAKLLHGRNRLFTHDDPLYIDKARAYPGAPMIIGADACQRLFDPKWGADIEQTLKEFLSLKTKFYVCDRFIDGKLVKGWDVVASMDEHLYRNYARIFTAIDGQWNISSTELRNKLNK